MMISLQRQRAAAATAGELARQAVVSAREMSDVDNSKPVALALASIAQSLAVLVDQATEDSPGIRVYDQSGD